MNSALILLAAVSGARAGPQRYVPPAQNVLPSPSQLDNSLINKVETDLYSPPARTSLTGLTSGQGARSSYQTGGGGFIVRGPEPSPGSQNNFQTFTSLNVEQPASTYQDALQPTFGVQRVESQFQEQPATTYQEALQPTFGVQRVESQFQEQPATTYQEALQPAFGAQRVQSQFQARPLPSQGSDVPDRYTRVDYDRNSAEVNRNPGGGNAGPLGVFVGACAASLVCVPEAMCNPYTGFVRGGLLFEPSGPSSQPTVALLRCYQLKDGGVGDGVCCQMPHINDPWPRAFGRK